MPLCVYCAEREAVGFEAGRLVCQHCKALENPVDVAIVDLDQIQPISMMVQ